MKTIGLLDKPAFSKNDTSKSVFRKNEDNNKVGFDSNNIKHVKKSGKLKGQKMFKA